MNPRPITSIERVTAALSALPLEREIQGTAALFLQAFRMATRWTLSVYVDKASAECLGKIEELRVALAQSLECLSHTVGTGAEVNEDVLFPHAIQYLAPASPQTTEDLRRLVELLRAEVVVASEGGVA